ncbi:MAG: hypothetical protein JWM55_1737 [Acidimicrobiaceae bacterium]|nr:hypothetical protein [Acidimicrobiaceae bacterium]
MAVVIVVIIFAALVSLVFYWSSRYGDANRSRGTSLKRGPHAHTTTRGQPKKGYASKSDAEFQAHKLATRDGAPRDVYKCATCTKWHVGHG